MEPQKRSKRKSILVASIMGIQAAITLMFLMFAFFQKAEADTQRQVAETHRAAAMRLEFQEVKAQKLIDSLTIELEKFKAIVEKK